MTLGKRLVILAFALGVFAGALALREMREDAADPASGTASTSAALPRLLDLGSNKCVPCKLMAPMLKELRKDFKGRMRVDFIDVRQNREVGMEYGLKVIPTQIFFAADGTELARHEGFMSREDILAKWDELGVDLGRGASRTEAD